LTFSGARAAALALKPSPNVCKGSLAFARTLSEISNL
jgi:hypothetical protein